MMSLSSQRHTDGLFACEGVWQVRDFCESRRIHTLVYWEQKSKETLSTWSAENGTRPYLVQVVACSEMKNEWFCAVACPAVTVSSNGDTYFCGL
mmetsp:Transcript_13125/g.23529  ORF Transcript_13125/g.23529 Transcript_13125/m.23529 type:complete len:94 (-) Transcript_13125:309-590(-)